MLKPTYRGPYIGSFACMTRVRIALDGSDASGRKSAPVPNFASGQEALRVGEEDLRAGKMAASIVALTYAAESGQVIARWKLGQMYAEGDGVPRDDVKAY